MFSQHTSPNQSRATLRAESAELLVEVLGFEFQDPTTAFDADWLVARVTWRGQGGTLHSEGPLFTIGELAAWGHGAIVGDETALIVFTEPNVQFACMARAASEERVVRVALLNEAKAGNTHVETRLNVTRGELVAFGRQLVEMARVVASRRVRPGLWQSRSIDAAAAASAEA